MHLQDNNFPPLESALFITVLVATSSCGPTMATKNTNFPQIRPTVTAPLTETNVLLRTINSSPYWQCDPLPCYSPLRLG